MGTELFMGQMEEKTEGERNMLKLKATYLNFSNAPVRDEYQFSHGFGACVPCIVRQTSNFQPRRRIVLVNLNHSN